MSGKMAKRIRRRIREVVSRDRAQFFVEYVSWLHSRPLRERIRIAWDIVRPWGKKDFDKLGELLEEHNVIEKNVLETSVEEGQERKPDDNEAGRQTG